MCGLRRKSDTRLLYLILFIILYLIAGASVFVFTENSSSEAEVKRIRLKKDTFKLKHTCVTDDELEDFLAAVIEANNRGVSVKSNVSNEPNWSFGQSLFFAGTVLTTIGYGRVTPLSEGGKLFCIFYATFGIPLTLIMFTALVERCMILTSWLLKNMSSRCSRVNKTLHVRLLHLLVIFSFIIVFIILLPAALFSYIEDTWNYLDAFYYIFISMTTIGLGDYIPGDDPHQHYRPLYKIMTTFYLFFGLVCMMLMLATMYDIPELNIGYHFYMRSDDDYYDESPDISSTENHTEKSERERLKASDHPPKMYSDQVNRGFQTDTPTKHEDIEKSLKH